jgi:hypothetical protein
MRSMLLVATLVLVAVGGWRSVPAAAPSGSPSYTPTGQLVRPADYRDWVYLTSGLGMTYGPAQEANGRPNFDNVFVTREAYQTFLRSGTWPDKTMFILEARRAEENVSINNGGRTQGALAFMEASVKDVKRFPKGGWGYFSFDGPNGLVESAAPLPATASCYECHAANTAVDNTFVQFYPTLFEIAKSFGTIKPTYDPKKKP